MIQPDDLSKLRMYYLMRSIWQNGFVCAKCGYRCDVPWSRSYTYGEGSRRGWRVECPTCHSQVSLADEKVRTLMGYGLEAMCRVFIVCQVYNVSLFSLLKRRAFDEFKPTGKQIATCKRARCAIIRELSDIVSNEDATKIFSVMPREVQAARKPTEAFNDVWKLAYEAREKERVKRERKARAKARAGKRSE